jgi:hypothetical protein
MSVQHIDSTSLVSNSDPYFCPISMYNDCSAYNTASYSSMITPSRKQMSVFAMANTFNTSAGDLTQRVELSGANDFPGQHQLMSSSANMSASEAGSYALASSDYDIISRVGQR